MEKQGVIKPGLTPPEQKEDTEHKTAAQAQSVKIVELDNDFRKRAAETVYPANYVAGK